MNPGYVAPGVIGGVCLLLALWGLQMLPINYAGLGADPAGHRLLRRRGLRAELRRAGHRRGRGVRLRRAAADRQRRAGLRHPAVADRRAGAGLGCVRHRHRRHGRQGAPPARGERHAAAARRRGRSHRVRRRRRLGRGGGRAMAGARAAALRPASACASRASTASCSRCARTPKQRPSKETRDEHSHLGSVLRPAGAARGQFAAHPARIRARRGVPARALLARQGPGPGRADPRHPADGAHRPAHRGRWTCRART